MPAIENVHRTIERVLSHPRVGEFDFGDRQRCRIQVDFIVDEPAPVDLAALSQSALDANRFEMGIEGLRIAGPERRRYVLPGDAFVWSILSQNQLRKHIGWLFPRSQIAQLQFYRFRSVSYLSTAAWARERELRIPLRRKDGLRVRLRLLNLLVIRQPQLLVQAAVVPKTGLPIRLELIFDPLGDVVEAFTCSACVRPTFDLQHHRGTLACPACVAGCPQRQAVLGKWTEKRY